MAKEARVPMTSEMQVAIPATSRLTLKASQKPGVFQAFSNHRSENPLGGKRRVWPLLNAAGITTAMGNTRKSSIAPT